MRAEACYLPVAAATPVLVERLTPKGISQIIPYPLGHGSARIARTDSIPPWAFRAGIEPLWRKNDGA